MNIDTSEVSPVWSRRTKRTVALICLLLVGLALWQVSEILPLLIVSVILAYLLTPLVEFNEQVLLRWLPVGRRGWSVVLAFVFMLLVFVLILLVVLPVLFNQVEEFGRNLPRILDNVETESQRILSEPLTFNGELIRVDGKPLIPLERLQEITGAESLSDLFQLQNFNLPTTLQGFIGSLGGLTGPAFNFVGGAFNTAVNLTFLVVMIFYLTKDGEKFLNRSVEILPAGHRRDARRFSVELGMIWNAYLRGQLILCTTIGSIVFAAAAILGLPNAAILGIIAGLLEFIPAIGPFLSLVLAVILALVSTSTTIPILSGASFALVVIVVWSAIQNIEAFFLVPRVMGDNLNLHPFAVIVAVIAGASLAGAPGVILAAPSLATLRLCAQYIYSKLIDVDPFPVQPDIRTTSTLPAIRVARQTRSQILQWLETTRTHLRRDQNTSPQNDPHSADSAHP